MTIDILFKKFDLFAAAPDAAAKMRELALHLALHGNHLRQSFPVASLTAKSAEPIRAYSAGCDRKLESIGQQKRIGPRMRAHAGERTMWRSAISPPDRPGPWRG